MPIQCALHPHADSSARQCRPKSRRSSTSNSCNEHCPPRTRVYFLMELVTGGELQGPLNHNQAGLRSAMAVSQRARKWRFVRSRSFAGMVIDSAFAHFFWHIGRQEAQPRQAIARRFSTPDPSCWHLSTSVREAPWGTERAMNVYSLKKLFWRWSWCPRIKMPLSLILLFIITCSSPLSYAVL